MRRYLDNLAVILHSRSETTKADHAASRYAAANPCLKTGQQPARDLCGRSAAKVAANVETAGGRTRRIIGTRCGTTAGKFWHDVRIRSPRPISLRSQMTTAGDLRCVSILEQAHRRSGSGWILAAAAFCMRPPQPLLRWLWAPVCSAWHTAPKPAWFRSCPFWVTQTRQSCRSAGTGFQQERGCVGGWSLPGVRLVAAEAVPNPAASANADDFGRSSLRAGFCPGAPHNGCA